MKKNHDGIVDTARAPKARLQKLGLGRILYEHTGNIGKAYRRHDEVGTPLCVTIDFETIEGGRHGHASGSGQHDSTANSLEEVPQALKAYYSEDGESA